MCQDLHNAESVPERHLEERNIKQIFQKILLCLYFPLVNIDQIGQNLKCEKGNAKRHDQFKQFISVSDPEKIENRITGLQ